MSDRPIMLEPEADNPALALVPTFRAARGRYRFGTGQDDVDVTRQARDADAWLRDAAIDAARADGVDVDDPAERKRVLGEYERAHGFRFDASPIVRASKVGSGRGERRTRGGWAELQRPEVIRPNVPSAKAWRSMTDADRKAVRAQYANAAPCAVANGDALAWFGTGQWVVNGQTLSDDGEISRRWADVLDDETFTHGDDFHRGKARLEWGENGPGRRHTKDGPAVAAPVGVRRTRTIAVSARRTVVARVGRSSHRSADWLSVGRRRVIHRSATGSVTRGSQVIDPRPTVILPDASVTLLAGSWTDDGRRFVGHHLTDVLTRREALEPSRAEIVAALAACLADRKPRKVETPRGLVGVTYKRTAKSRLVVTVNGATVRGTDPARVAASVLTRLAS